MLKHYILAVLLALPLGAWGQTTYTFDFNDLSDGDLIEYNTVLGWVQMQATDQGKDGTTGAITSSLGSQIVSNGDFITGLSFFFKGPNTVNVKYLDSQQQQIGLQESVTRDNEGFFEHTFTVPEGTTIVDLGNSNTVFDDLVVIVGSEDDCRSDSSLLFGRECK